MSMENNIYERKHKENMPVLAICYDFDKTLSPDDMQAQGYIQEVGYDVKDFWTESNQLAENNDMDQNLAYMYKMVEKSRGKLVFNRRTLEEYGSRVSLFPGVEEWFERIKQYGLEHGVIVEHYIISCGLKEMIDGTSVAKNGAFEKIYASSFYYDEYGVALWPAQVINYTNKTQFLFRISKGVLNINDQGVNDSFGTDEIRVPFRNMVYIGDSDTDVPCMKLINSYGGHSVGVYNAETKDKTKVYKMMREGRIKYYMPADYRDGTELDGLIKAIIDRTATNEILESVYAKCKNENQNADKLCSDEEKIKLDLIMALENSRSFATTHMIIKEMQQQENWSDENKEALFKIACENSQVSCILTDKDVKRFYKKLTDGLKIKSEYLESVLRKI
ncbi:MAG: haloacid dehalogenase-like hydrolase [Clostridia bacterium]|nr:haloacid dehalogenase-like hydrolase [Clostridia bacterium]